MKMITIEQARAQVKSDGFDDDQLTVYANAAEAACARLANRSLFATTDELATALEQVPAKLGAAWATYDAAVIAADSMTDTRAKLSGREVARVRLQHVVDQQEAITHGIALDSLSDGEREDIIGAILLATAHFYRNREAVATGAGAAAVEVPFTTAAVMSHHRWIGYL